MLHIDNISLITYEFCLIYKGIVQMLYGLVYMSGMILGAFLSFYRIPSWSNHFIQCKYIQCGVKMTQNHILRKSMVMSWYQILFISCVHIEAYMNYISEQTVLEIPHVSIVRDPKGPKMTNLVRTSVP